MLKRWGKNKRNSKHVILTEPSVNLTLNDVLFLFNFGHFINLDIINEDCPQMIHRYLSLNNIEIELKELETFSLTIKVKDNNEIIYKNSTLKIGTGQKKLGATLQKVLLLKSSPAFVWEDRNDLCMMTELSIQSMMLRINNILANIESSSITDERPNLKIQLEIK